MEGMTDNQYNDVLRGFINDLERIKRLGVSEEAAEEIDQMIARFKATIQQK